MFFGKWVPTFWRNVLPLYWGYNSNFPRSWRQWFPPKQRHLCTKLHGITTQNTITLILTAMAAQNLKRIELLRGNARLQNLVGEMCIFKEWTLNYPDSVNIFEPLFIFCVLFNNAVDYWDHIASVIDKWMIVGPGENQSTWRKMWPSATALSTTNPTWSVLGMNLDCHGKRPVTNCLNHGMAPPLGTVIALN